ncbi:MAG: DUF3310 domain-containing protein [Rhodospirillaceae bacterium]
MDPNVEHPAHYTRGGYETIDFIEQYFESSYHAGQVVKYLSRAGYKHGAAYRQDVQKALWYARRMYARPMQRWHMPNIDHDDFLFDVDLRLFAEAKLLDGLTITAIREAFRGYWRQVVDAISEIDRRAQQDAPQNADSDNG